MMQRRIARIIADHNLIAAGQTLVVGVSGGIDSVALLHILLQLREGLGIRLRVASLDHGLRGEAGADDLAFVRDLAADWSLPFSGERVDVPALAARAGMGLEAAARQARYDFLAEVAGKHGGAAVAVGHHAGDQAETIMLNIVRGAGLAGLRGMRLKTPLPNQPQINLIRPLLHQSRDEIEAYVAGRGLPFRHDASNDDLAYRRNYLRHRVIAPILEREPKALEAFARLAEAAAIDDAFIEERFEFEALPHVLRRESRWSVAKSDLLSWHVALRRRFLRLAASRLGGVLSHRTTLESLDWIDDAGSGKRLDLGGGLRLRVEYGMIHIERRDARADCRGYRLIAAEAEIALAAPADLRIGGMRLRLTHDELRDDARVKLHVPAGSDLRLRTRRSGERFRPKGMGGRSRKLKDWMMDHKIPRELRSRIPLICLDGDIIAICVGETWHLADLSHLSGDSGAGLHLALE